MTSVTIRPISFHSSEGVLNSLLLNDTSYYHHGCVEVVKVLVESYRISRRITRIVSFVDTLRKVDLAKFDRVILNGEGTMHHSAACAVQFLGFLREAQIAGCETYIVNTVWQGMSHAFDDVLRNSKLLSVREVLSQKEMEKHGVLPRVYPDLSYFSEVPFKKYPHRVIYEGQYYDDQKIGKYPRVNIFKQSWHTLVNMLRNCDLLITGRHHEMYAACKARCRFIVKPGNTWKNVGLLESAGVSIPFDVSRVLSGEFDEQYEKLWVWLDSFCP